MKPIDDQDIRYYLRVFLVGLALFLGLGFLFFFIFHNTYEVNLSKSQFEYGSSIRIVDQIESIGNTQITKKMRISENTIKTEEYEATIDSVNTRRLGNQTLKIDFSNPEIPDTAIDIQIIDTKKPVIKIKQKQPVEMTIQQMQNKEFQNLFILKDNHTPVEKMELSINLDKDSFKPGDNIKLFVQATDVSGNKTKRTIKIHIQEEKKKEQKPNEETKDSPVGPANNVQIPSSPSAQESYTPPVQQTPPPAPKPANKQFLFSDGYDMSSAPSACQQELLSSGRAGACTPLQDAEGIYYGMQLTYY